MASVDSYRVLVVDDDRDMCEVAKAEIMEIRGSEHIVVDVAYTPQAALSMARTKLYDLIILDLYRYRELAGYEIYRKLSELGCSAEVVLMTRFDLDASVKTLLQVLASQTSLVLVGFVDKRENGLLRRLVSNRYAQFSSARLEAVNLGLASSLIDGRRARYEGTGSFPLREDLVEIDAEVDRLLCGLYVEVSPSEYSTKVSVALDRIRRIGLGASVLVIATVRVDLEGTGKARYGQRTILKIGPKRDIFEEASRFRAYVRYGTELEQRVELMEVEAKDSLGALVYCFAGGLYQNTITSLDDRLIEDMLQGDMKESLSVLHGLLSSRSWYSVRVDDVDVGSYFKENFRTDLMRSCSVGEDELRQLPNALGPTVRVEAVSTAGKEAHFEVSVGSAEILRVPTSSVLGLGSMYRTVPASLVHGNMHGGNVLLEVCSAGEQPEEEQQDDAEVSRGRVCLIDFGSAGPGPRTIDAVALEASIRLSDSKALCRQLHGSEESDLSDIDRLAVAENMAERTNDELALYRAVFKGIGGIPAVGWCLAAAEVLTSMRDSFADVTLEEYLRTSIRYTLRLLGFELQPVERIRLLAWLAAQYRLLS